VLIATVIGRALYNNSGMTERKDRFSGELKTDIVRMLSFDRLFQVQAAATKKCPISKSSVI